MIATPKAEWVEKTAVEAEEDRRRMKSPSASRQAATMHGFPEACGEDRKAPKFSDPNADLP